MLELHQRAETSQSIIATWKKVKPWRPNKQTTFDTTEHGMNYNSQEKISRLDRSKLCHYVSYKFCQFLYAHVLLTVPKSPHHNTFN